MNNKPSVTVIERLLPCEQLLPIRRVWLENMYQLCNNKKIHRKKYFCNIAVVSLVHSTGNEIFSIKNQSPGQSVAFQMELFFRETRKRGTSYWHARGKRVIHKLFQFSALLTTCSSTVVPFVTKPPAQARKHKILHFNPQVLCQRSQSHESTW